MRHTVPSAPPPQERRHKPIQRSTSITVYKQPHLTTIHSSALSSLRKVVITESARKKLSSSHHAFNSLLFALDGYPTATEDPAEIEETVRTETVGGGDTGSGRERRDWVPPLRGTHSSPREDFTSPEFSEEAARKFFSVVYHSGPRNYAQPPHGCLHSHLLILKWIAAHSQPMRSRELSKK